MSASNKCPYLHFTMDLKELLTLRLSTAEDLVHSTVAQWASALAPPESISALAQLAAL